MIRKYYNSILEQVFAQIGKKEHNIVLAKYSNDFSLKQLEISEQITNNKEVHFAAHEFRAEKLSGAYEPFLDLILELFDRQKEMTFDEFLGFCIEDLEVEINSDGKDNIIDNWLETQNAYKEQDPKTVYYMSMEFLMGRALGNNLINLTAYKEVKEALDELGLDLNVIEDQEPDPALGNGGLGRLAACFLRRRSMLKFRVIFPQKCDRTWGCFGGISDHTENQVSFRHSSVSSLFANRFQAIL